MTTIQIDYIEKEVYILIKKTMGYFVTPEGEIIEELKEGDSYTIKRDGKNSPTRIKINHGENFVKVYYKKTNELMKILTPDEFKFLNYLTSHIVYLKNTLCCENGKVLTRQKMEKDCNISIRQIDRMLKTLEENDIIFKGKSGNRIYFIANPFLFMKGGEINELTYDFFKDSKWAK